MSQPIVIVCSICMVMWSSLDTFICKFGNNLEFKIWFLQNKEITLFPMQVDASIVAKVVLHTSIAKFHTTIGPYLNLCFMKL